MTELAFLLDLLLNHKLPMATKRAVSERIKEVEMLLSSPPQGRVNAHVHAVGTVIKAPESQAIVNVAQTPAAQAALAAREALINQAMSGKPAPGETQPRKARGALT